ncbi:MAG: sulfatase [Planctomycetes bacterium]|nr:sulfatase [Planctomycetota bacterium]MBI3846810.1 sulfatase [Planctomycetota bacterium]
MKLRRRATAGAASLLLVGSSCAPPKPHATGPSLLLVTLDTVRADRLGCYGRASAATPILDRLAREGARFERAYAVAPLTLPSHASMLTGLYPNRHGLRDNGAAPLRREVPTFAAILHDRGYDTAAFVGGAPLDHRFGLDRGFDLYDDAFGARAGSYSYPERSADRTTAAALDWLAPRLAAKDAASFALWVHYFDAHAPYAPPPPFADRFRDSPYEGEIAFVDAQLGRLIDAIEKAGRLDRTAIVVVADHGEGLGEHGERTHGCLLYDSTLRVPLIVRAPGRVAAASVRADRISGVDLLPTALALLDVPAPRDIDGVDRLLADASSAAPLYAECLAPFFQYAWAPQFAARDPRTGSKRIWDGPVKIPLPPDEDATQPVRDADAAALDAAIGAYASRTAADGTRAASGSSAPLQALGYLGSAAPIPDPSALATFPAASTRLPILDTIDAAISARQGGNDREAEALFADACKRDPTNPSAHFMLGSLRFERGKKLPEASVEQAALDGEALVDLAIAANMRPTDARAVDACASVEFALGYVARKGSTKDDAERALRFYSSAERRLVQLLAARPEDCNGWRILVGIHTLEGSPLVDLDRACAELHEWSTHCPGDEKARDLQAQLQCR